MFDRIFELPPADKNGHISSQVGSFGAFRVPIKISYILAFQKKYGVLDPEDTGDAAKAFLESFAGAWAATLGTSDGIGSLDANQVAEWLSAIKHHTEL